VKKRLDESRFSRYGAAASRDKANSKAPDAAMIREATARLTSKGVVRKTRETVSADEVLNRKISLITRTVIWYK